MARKRKRGSRRRHTATLTSFAQNRFNDDLDIRSGGSEKGNLAVHDVETFGHDKVQSSSHEAGGISQSERPHLLYTLHEEGHHLPQTRHEAAAPSSKLTSEPSRSPSADYLSISTTPSLRLDVPSALRKLLILDLNGTLLLRSPHQRQHRYGNPPTRKVHPRPYLGTFVSYLFHEEVQKWLDTMVWSSARPHNVADMTETCFGGKRRRLVAIWTRDDMGLTEAEYYRKTETVKDLEKPWAHLSPPRPPSPSGSPSIEERRPDGAHSARTTLLLDDSVSKAVLQPYNHLCVPEYDRITRAADLRVLHHHQRSASAQRTSEGEGTHEDTSTTAEEDATRGAKRKRKSKKKASGLTAPEGGGSGAGRYDQALLAVVGILDALKLEDNVSHWIRARRVWPDQEPAAKQPRTLAADPDREPPTKKPRTLAADPGDAGADADADMLWWKDAAALEHWASRGKEALAELGIEPDAGIED